MAAFAVILVEMDKSLDQSRNGWDAISGGPLVAQTCLPLLVYGFAVVR